MKSKVWLAILLFVMLAASFVFVVAAERISPAADARSSYNGKCASCHGRDGRGKSFRGRLSHARDLTDANWQNDVSDERIFNSISNGRGKMPGFKKSLSENEIEALVVYVRRLRK